MARSAYLFVLIASMSLLSCINATEDFQNEALKVHNEYRSMHHVGDLVLDDDLNDAAKKCVDHYFSQNAIDHTCQHKDGAGENLWAINNGQLAKKDIAQQATKMWYDEVDKYNFNKPGFDSGTGHFTQVVWKGSKKLGFGVRVEGEKAYAVALYKPPGNIVSEGEFNRNVLPKTKSGGSSAASRMQISLNTFNTLAIYSIGICYALLNFS